VIVLVHLRLRTLPRADITYVLEGAREDLTQVGEDIAGAGLTPAALELVSQPSRGGTAGFWLCAWPDHPRWCRRTKQVLRSECGGRFAPLRAEEAHAFWMRLAEDSRCAL